MPFLMSTRTCDQGEARVSMMNDESGFRLAQFLSEMLSLKCEPIVGFLLGEWYDDYICENV